MTPTPISPAIIGDTEQFLLYGGSKQGKTPLALTLPRPIYFLAVGRSNEAKVFYSKPFQEKHGKYFKKDDLIIDVGHFSQECKDLANKAIEGCLKGTGPQFASIVVDNATRLIEMHVDVAMEVTHGMKEAGDKDTSKTALQKLKDTGATMLQKGDWGVAQGIMQRFVSDLLSTDFHVAFVAHEYWTYGPGPAQTQIPIKVEPNFIGKDRQNIPNMFDNMWRVTRDKDTIVARTDTTLDERGYEIVAGSRIGGVLQKEWLNPDLSKAIEKFRKHAEEMAVTT